MNIDFALILVLLVVGTGLLGLIDMIFLAPSRKADPTIKQPLIFEYARSFFPVLLLVLLIRSFIFEPFRIPSGSLKPTLLVGDFIVVTKYDYGLRWPITNKLFYPVDKPKRGQIVVFRYPSNPSMDYIKRVIGLPGDTIEYHNKQLSINGKLAEQKIIGYTVDTDDRGNTWQVEKREENLDGVKHAIIVRPTVKGKDFKVTVPKGHYFVMGDNRDDSNDSRYWGFLPDKNLIGHARVVWLSWDSLRDRVRWSRFGTVI